MPLRSPCSASPANGPLRFGAVVTWRREHRELAFGLWNAVFLRVSQGVEWVGLQVFSFFLVCFHQGLEWWCLCSDEVMGVWSHGDSLWSSPSLSCSSVLLLSSRHQANTKVHAKYQNTTERHEKHKKHHETSIIDSCPSWNHCKAPLTSPQDILFFKQNPMEQSRSAGAENPSLDAEDPIWWFIGATWWPSKRKLNVASDARRAGLAVSGLVDG